MAKHHNKDWRPGGEVRRSQLLTTYGPGALVDLVDDAVIVGGLGQWRYGSPSSGYIKNEVRLQKLAQKKLAAQSFWDHPTVRLRMPPDCDDEHPTAQRGIGVWAFPRWFVCQSEQCRSLVHKTGLDDSGRHVCRHGGKAWPVVPIRFVAACPHAHLQDIDWNWFAHRGEKDLPEGIAEKPGVYCKRSGPSHKKGDPLGAGYTSPLYLDVLGTSGELTDFIVGCRQCGKVRGLQDLSQGKAAIGTCRGLRPWLGYGKQEECPEPERLKVVTRTASNLYFAQLLSVLSIPDPSHAIEEAVESIWDFVQTLPHIEALTQVMQWQAPVKAAVSGLNLYDVWAAIEARKSGKSIPQPRTRETEWRAMMKAPFEGAPGLAEPNARWHPLRAQIEGLPSFVDRVVLIHNLTEVRAQIGFTRLDSPSPDAEGEYELPVGVAPLGHDEDWVPAVEIYGEGIFVAFDMDTVLGWEQKNAAVAARTGRFREAFKQYNARYGSDVKFPGARLVMLHTLAHLLIQAISLECGYPATAIRERIYCFHGDHESDQRAGILLYTGTPGTEGTLGGLVAAGRDIVRHLRHAAELGRLCAHDPICAQHEPDAEGSDRLRAGAACHGCVLIGEPSCERMNRDLDRTLVVPTVEETGAAFLGPWMATWG